MLGLLNLFQYDEYEEYEDSYYEYNNFAGSPPNPIPTLGETYVNCVIPSLRQISIYIATLIGWNITFRFIWMLTAYYKVTNYLPHYASMICGFGLLYSTAGDASLFLIMFGVFSFVALRLLIYHQFRNFGYILGAICIGVLIACEVSQTNLTIWHKIRGMQMVQTMKVISLAFDMETVSMIDRRISFSKYMGYLLCPGNATLGPWIPYKEYLAIFKSPIEDLKWVLWTLTSGTMSIGLLLLSNCFVHNLCSDLSWKWFVAYRDALSFRYSHYFISFLSQATMASSGAIGGTPADDLNKYFGYVVTKPSKNELPRSLGQVVINWNIPMHRWLKTYVFRVVKPHSTLMAIFATYIMSSLLHGLNFQIYAVLLSLGLYTYVEHSIRLKISNIFRSCTLSMNCGRNCNHEYKSKSLLSLVVNGFFFLMAIFHLAYLGVMFDSAASQDIGYSLSYTITKWRSLDFLSHIVVFSMFLFNSVI